MKRLALALAAAATLGTGCIATTDNTTTTCDPAGRTLTIAWQFADATGTPQSCAGMAGNGFGAIATVNVYIDNVATPTTSACTDYAVTWDNSLGSLPSGTHTLTVEGLDASGAIVARDQFTVNIAYCGNTSVQAVASQGTMDIAYSLPGNQCTGGYMWFSVTDTIANAAVLYADATTNPTAYACGSPLTFVMPTGSYSLDWIQDVDASGTSFNQYCTAIPFDVSPATTSTVQVALSPTPVGATCP